MKTARIIKNRKSQEGFTLIELLVVIGILAVLLSIVLIAINPAKQFSQANNTKRRSDVNAILNAVDQYSADNKGTLPTGIGSSFSEISKSGGADLCTSLVTKYIAALPVDPKVNNGTPVTDCASSYSTGYFILQSATDSRVTVSAAQAELSDTIMVTR